MLRKVAVLLGALAALGGGLAVAQPGTLEQAKSACEPGADPQPAGPAYTGKLATSAALTPQRIPGAVSVSPAEARCMLVILAGKAKVLQTFSQPDRLPGSQVLSKGALDPDTPTMQTAFEEQLRAIAADKSTPLIVYCQNETCPFSYNVSLRAVRAGYQNVFWLRQGSEGWLKAGYALAPIDAKSTAERLALCDRPLSYGSADYAQDFLASYLDGSMAQRDAIVALRIRRERKDCLQRLARSYEWPAASKADLDARLARSDAEAAAAFEKARTSVVRNPKEHLALGEGVTVETLRGYVPAAQSILAREECPDFDRNVQRPTNQAQAEQIAFRLLRLSSCLETNLQRLEDFDEEVFNDALRWARRAAPLTCRRTPGPNCIPDAQWEAVNALDTAANRTAVRDAGAIARERERVYEQALDELDEWVEAFASSTSR